MEDFSKYRITNISEAEIYFKNMGCSHFHMCREYPNLYEEYIGLRIKKEMEIKWRQEQIDFYISQIYNNTDPEAFWVFFSTLEYLYKEQSIKENINQIYKACLYMKNKCARFSNILIGETIIGRQDNKYRPGLIFSSFDFNLKEMAKDFAELAKYFCDTKNNETNDIKRCLIAMEKIDTIVVELGIA